MDDAPPSDTAELRVWIGGGIGVPRGSLLRLRRVGERTWGEYYVRHAALAARLRSGEDSARWAAYAREDRAALTERYGCQAFAVAGEEGVCRVPFRRGKPEWPRLWTALDSLAETAAALPAPATSSRTHMDSIGASRLEVMQCHDGFGVMLERRAAHAKRVDRPGLNACTFASPTETRRAAVRSAIQRVYDGVDSVAAGYRAPAGAP